MNNFLDTFNSLPVPYSDLAVVVVLFIGLYLIGLIISKLAGTPPSVEADIEHEPPPPPETDELEEVKEVGEEVAEQVEELPVKESHVTEETPGTG